MIDHIVEAHGMVLETIGGKMKITTDQQNEQLSAIIMVTPDQPSQWRHLLQVAMWAIDTTEVNGLHKNIPVIEGDDGSPDSIIFNGGPDEAN